MSAGTVIAVLLASVLWCCAVALLRPPRQPHEGGLQMAEVTRNPQRTTTDGAEPAVIEGLNSADTQVIPNKNGDVVLRVTNGGAEATNVTIVTPGEVGGNAVADKVVAVGAGKTALIGPFDPATYNDAKGNLAVQLSKVVSVKLEVTKVAG